MSAIKNSTIGAKVYIAAIAALGIVLLLNGLWHWHVRDPLTFLVFFGLGLMASGMKVGLPGITGTMSVNFLIGLIAICELSLPEVLVISMVSTLVQCVYKSQKRPSATQVLFNLGSIALTVNCAYLAYHYPLPAALPWAATDRLRAALDLQVVRLMLMAITYFAVNTVAIAIVVSWTERRGLWKTWQEYYGWSFWYYLIGAALAGLYEAAYPIVSTKIVVLLAPIVIAVYKAYGLYLGKLESERQHAVELTSLHLRTIEALACAIDAKDNTTHDHLQRVQVYAMAVGEELGLAEEDMKALRAASLLHDIGKLAVPEHIISKPGKLSHEEFEKMKVHPVVGAEILERVQFPYPVVPIVRSHHEKWDGSGYPDGLAGERIPIGARILSAVDTLDALASDRQYRRALPLDEAMAEVARHSGKSFDPRVVEILARRYQELENTARTTRSHATPLSTDLVIERGDAPAAGYETESPAKLISSIQSAAADAQDSLVAAGQAAQAIVDLAQNGHGVLTQTDFLSLVAPRVKSCVAFDALAIYLKHEQKLLPGYVTGENHKLFSQLEIPIGDGLSGWVAENHKCIMNGNPSVEPGYLNDPTKFSTLRSATAVPLETDAGVLGVMTLYRAERDAFQQHDLQLLKRLAAKIALGLELLLPSGATESAAETDPLTGLPRTASLFAHLTRAAAECAGSGSPLAVVALNLGGLRSLNHRHGRETGDRVVRMFGLRLQAACRESDFAARLGGDQFAVVLPGVPREEVQAFVRKLSAGVNEIGLPWPSEVPLFLHVGEAYSSEDSSEAEQLVNTAERRLQRGKKQRRQAAIAAVRDKGNWVQTAN